MTHICVCKYPLLIIDKRDGEDIEYFAMPLDVIDSGIVPIPDIDTIETEGLDGIVRNYISITWKPVTPDMHTKKYDVAGHVVTAGCELSDATKGDDGDLKCDNKSIYVVLHPIEEWMERHVVEISPGKTVS